MSDGMEVILMFAGAAMLAGWVIRRNSARSSEAEQGRCALCGYDLRAAAEQCPECGLPVPYWQQPIDIDSEAESGVAGWQELVVDGPIIAPREPGPDERRVTV